MKFSLPNGKISQKLVQISSASGPEGDADFALQAAKTRVKFRRLLYSPKMLRVCKEEKITDYLDSFVYTCGTEIPEMFQLKLFDCYGPI